MCHLLLGCEREKSQIMSNSKQKKEEVFDESMKWPVIMNSKNKYLNCLKKMNSLDKFTAFMEDTLIVNTLHLTDEELWAMIQKISQDVIATNHVSIPSISVQQWIVDYYHHWETMREKKEPEMKSEDNSLSSKTSGKSSESDESETTSQSSATTDSFSDSDSSSSSSSSSECSESESGTTDTSEPSLDLNGDSS